MSQNIIYFPDNAKETISKHKNLKVKFGIDPTSPNLHLGHLVPIRICRKLQEQGHPLDLVLGTLTAQLGDPSGQDKTRPFLSKSVVEENSEKILTQVSKLLMPGFRVQMNDKFASMLTVSHLLKELVGKFTVNQMLSRDAFRLRMGNDQPIGLHELIVPILQGYDSVFLETRIEVGGSDQLFNFQITRMLQESFGQIPEVCVMSPIIRGTDGRKMSKTYNNAIFVDSHPDDMFGKIMSISDDVMNEWIPLLTNREIDDSHPMEAKKNLAQDIVEQLHGPQSAYGARIIFERMYEKKYRDHSTLINPIPVTVGNKLFEIVSWVMDHSRSKARSLIDQKAVKVNGQLQKDPLFVPIAGDSIKIGKFTYVKMIEKGK